MSALSRPAGISGENATVETTYFGTPIGRARAQSSARSVPMVPPIAIMPSIRRSSCRRRARREAPRAMICIAAFSSAAADASAIDEPAAAATSCLLTATTPRGSPSTPTSIVSTAPPCLSMHVTRKPSSSDFVS
jgi:hypothetical protein